MPTRAQTARLFAAQREIGWEREQLYDLVERVSGARSVSRMSVHDAAAVIDVLVRAGAKEGKNARPRGRKTAANETLLITPAQRDEIGRLRAVLGGRWLYEPYYEGACTRVIRKPRPTTAGNGARVIEMLKQRLAHAGAAR